jgi:hypothetical protein
MCACLADRVAAHKELERCVESIPSVEAVDYLAPEESASGRPETEIVVRATPTGTAPNSLLCKICQSSLGLETVRPANNPDYKHVVVR